MVADLGNLLCYNGNQRVLLPANGFNRKETPQLCCGWENTYKTLSFHYLWMNIYFMLRIRFTV